MKKWHSFIGVTTCGQSGYAANKEGCMANLNIIEMLFPEKAKDIKEGRCPGCQKSVEGEHYRDAISVRESEISGLCQKCQDDIFGYHPEDSFEQEDVYRKFNCL